MTNWQCFITHICLLICIGGYQNADAQQQLPFGAKVRFGMDKGAISDTAFTPDGTQIAIASRMGVWLYDAATGKETALAPATPFDVSAIAFSPDGKMLAGGSDVGAIWLQRIDTGEIRHFSPRHTRRILSVAFSPDGKTLTSGGLDKTIGLWDTETGTFRRRLTGHADTVNVVAFSPDGKILASGSSDRTVRLWNPETGKPWKTFLKHKDVEIETFSTELAFSPDGKMIASGGTEWPELLVWEVQTGKVRLTHHSFSPDRSTLASSSADGTILLWDWHKIRSIR